MNKITLVSGLLLGMVLVAPANAGQDSTAGRVSPAVTATRDTPSNQAGARSNSVERIHEMMQVMQAQMNAIRNADDPRQRRKLMRTHRASMEAMMQTLHADDSRRGSNLPTGSHEIGAPSQQGSGQQPCRGPAMGDRHARMVQRMDYMQKQLDTIHVVLEQMLAYQNATEEAMEKLVEEAVHTMYGD